MRKATLLCLAMLILAGCATEQVEDTPSREEPQPVEESAELPDLTEGEVTYYICEHARTGETIHRSSWCGPDSCWDNFYDAEGELIEDTPEMGLDAEPYTVKTRTKGCVLVSQEYFSRNAPADNPVS